MDFDRKFGNAAAGPVVTKGRGFNEKPMPRTVVVQRQPRRPVANRKVTPKTQFVVTNRPSAPRRNGNFNNGRRPAGMNEYGQQVISEVSNNRAPRGYARGNRRGNGHVNRGPRRGNDDRFVKRNAPKNENQLDADLDKYFAKDPEIMNQKLDSDLDAYMQRRSAVDQSTDVSIEMNPNQMQ